MEHGWTRIMRICTDLKKNQVVRLSFLLHCCSSEIKECLIGDNPYHQRSSAFHSV